MQQDRNDEGQQEDHVVLTLTFCCVFRIIFAGAIAMWIYLPSSFHLLDMSSSNQNRMGRVSVKSVIYRA